METVRTELIVRGRNDVYAERDWRLAGLRPISSVDRRPSAV
jgi:hypothetical protein